MRIVLVSTDAGLTGIGIGSHDHVDERLIQTEAVDVLQLDVARVGGINGASPSWCCSRPRRSGVPARGRRRSL